MELFAPNMSDIPAHEFRDAHRQMQVQIFGFIKTTGADKAKG